MDETGAGAHERRWGAVVRTRHGGLGCERETEVAARVLGDFPIS